MSRWKMPKFPSSDAGSGDDPTNPPPPLPGRGRNGAAGAGPWATLVALVLIGGVIYAGYFWFVRRIVVGPGEVLVLLKKDGTRSLPNDQIVIPRAPDAVKEAQAYAAWEAEYGDVNG